MNDQERSKGRHSDRKRFDGWSPVVPRVGQVIQVMFSKITFETEVKARYVYDGGETFEIDVSNVYGTLVLCIAPSASAGGMVDIVNDRKPYWRVGSRFGVPSAFGEFIKIFFLEDGPVSKTRKKK